MRSSRAFVKSCMLFFAMALLTTMFSSSVKAKEFAPGDQVEVTRVSEKGLRVLDTACGNSIGGKLNGAVGMVLEGPVFCLDHNRRKIRWEDGLEGWSAEDYLKRKDFVSSRNFRIGDRIEVSNIDAYGLKVRSDPPELTEKGNVRHETTGTIKDGPFYGIAERSSGVYHFWKVEYDNGVAGWSAEQWLKSAPDLKVGDTPIEPARSDSGETLETSTETEDAAKRAPDLEVDSIWIEPTKFDPGETVEIFIRIKNTGSGDARSFPGVSVKGTFDGRACYEEGMERLNAGAHTGDALHWTYVWSSDTNPHLIGVEVDPDNHIPESDESNNALATPFSASSTMNWVLFLFLWLGLLGIGYPLLVSNRMRRMARGIEGLEGKMDHLEAVLLGREG